ncbi:ABC transporter ATP-binding protein [Vreelandella sp. TE19]
MPELAFRDVSKSFGTQTVVDSFTADVKDSEFLVLLGPSGCGKSTLLRMIAGLGEISSGELLFDGQRANEWGPRERGIAFVFQSYALYPHMSVRANIAFPLIMNRFRTWQHLPIVNAFYRWKLMRDPKIARKTQEMAEQLELTPMLDRRPSALSGGQRQRVALARALVRALVRDPSIYLLDEPLSNLDAKLRTQMRSEISALHQKVGKTFIYVTHDQVEAMTMATRIIIMNQGVIQQVGTPEEIYDNPCNIFVARFIGSPAMNLVTVDVEGNRLTSSCHHGWVHPGVVPSKKQVTLGIRPEKLEMVSRENGLLHGRVAVIERLGAETIVGVQLGTEEEGAALIERDMVFARIQGNVRCAVGEPCSLSYQAADAYWFDAESGERMLDPHGQAIDRPAGEPVALS